MNNLTFYENDATNNITMLEALFTDKLNMNGAIRGWANPTGMLLLLISIIMLIGVHPKIRQKGKKLFYHSHNLSHWPLYPDVLKVKTIHNCCETKMPHLFIKIVHKSIIFATTLCRQDVPAAVWLKMDLWTIF